MSEKVDPADIEHGPGRERATGDEDSRDGLPLGSLAGLLGAALAVLLVALSQGWRGPFAAEGAGDAARATATASPTATATAGPSLVNAGPVSPPPRPPTARVFYLVSDWDQAQELAAAFSGGATGGEILLAGTAEQEARAWQVIGNHQSSIDELTAQPPRVIDLREPGYSTAPRR